MTGELKAMLAGHQLLELLDLIVLKLDDDRTGCADQVVVVILVEDLGRFVAGGAVEEFSLRSDPRINKQTHGPIDSGVTNARMTLLYVGKQLIDGDMAAALNKCAQNLLTLARLLQPIL